MTRQQWMAMLAKLTAPMEAVSATRGLCDMLPMLGDFPDGAWCAASLDYVAGQCRRVPVYSEVRQYLGQWWGPRDTMPKLPAPPVAEWRVNIPKPRDPATEAELAAVDGIMHAWRMEIGYGKSRPLEHEAAPEPKLLAPGVLLASYEKLAAQGDKAAKLRLEMLRRHVEPESKPPPGDTPRP